MTTTTIFSGLSLNQQDAGLQSMPNTIVSAPLPGFDRASVTLTVTPSTGWAEATVFGSFDNANWIGGGVAYVAPNSGGTETVGNHFTTHPYATAVLTKIAPGCTASLTFTY